MTTYSRQDDASTQTGYVVLMVAGEDALFAPVISVSDGLGHWAGPGEGKHHTPETDELAAKVLDAINGPDSKVLAQDVLAMAQAGGMPSSYWQTDRRIARACAVLGVAPEHAEEITADAFKAAQNEDEED